MNKKRVNKTNKINQNIKKVEKEDAPQPSQEEAIEQFELELCWCIQKLSFSLENNKKLTQHQCDDLRKTLTKLSSKKAPLIQKRQLMRTTFGDYRAEMAKDEKQHLKDELKLKFHHIHPNKQSQFFKRIKKTPNSESSIKDGEDKNFKFISSDNSFRFDFLPEHTH